MQVSKPMGLTTKIMLGMFGGAIVGVLLNQFGADSAFVQAHLVNGVLRVVGDVFVAGLKMLVVPLVLVSLVGGVTALGDVNALGRIGLKALLLYLFTTAVAISIALGLAVAVNPGQGFDLGSAQTAPFEAKPAPSLADVLIDMVPANPVAAMADGNMLQIIVFALLFGLAITLAGERGRHVYHFFSDLDAVIMHMVDTVMKLAPYGVFALIAKTFASLGLSLLLPLLGYFLCVVAALALHAFGTLSLLLRLLGRLNPLLFFYKLRAVALFAFSTASSNATIPVSLKTSEEKLGVDNAVASFTIPLGATINMDGTAIMQGVATVFIANVYGVDLGLADYLAVVLTATLASIGTAGVPGVGLVMLTMVLVQVGLPVEGVALIIGVDRLLDMLRTVVNVSGDIAVTCLIARSEKQLDSEVFNRLDD